ncbi:MULTISPECIES: DUF262 domain-containing protein [unclassified Lysinibacillus]|uniref:DUF262 domain-containing protein n=1 Tax=unclassified Lysinibacillus TaxID=2636778 RepID=UPI0037F71C53
MDLENQGRLNRRNFDISFNELYDMYKDEELIIQPEFQRLFRWSGKQQSLFMESLLLDMPVPPIYVDEQVDGSYVLVDGLQRISSYLNFRGIELNIVNEEATADSNEEDIYDDIDEELSIMDVPPGFKLSGCEIRKDLNGKSYDELSIIDRRNLKRVFIRVEVLTKDNEKSVKYHMFKRLNSGGAMLSEQELRNSNIRMVDNRFIDFINDLAKNTDFKNLTSYMQLSEIQKMKPAENVLRYFLFKNKFLNNGYEKDRFKLDEELTLYLEEVTESKVDFNYEIEKENFEGLVKYLSDNFGPGLFGGVSKASERIMKKFIQYNFDGFMLYFSNENTRKNTITLEQITNIKKSSEYLSYRTGGIEKVKSRISYINSKLGE